MLRPAVQSEGKSDAFVGGKTGAQMAASLVVLRLHGGLSRPAIATVFPTARHPSSSSTPARTSIGDATELYNCARGSVYAEDVLGAPTGCRLLSIGEERGEGERRGKEAHQLLTTPTVTSAATSKGGTSNAPTITATSTSSSAMASSASNPQVYESGHRYLVDDRKSRV